MEGKPSIRVVPLGAGQDVGRSCILVSMGGKNVMFDCGMHMGYNDERRFPDFTFLARTGPLTHLLDAVIISHFHLDHCGALPYFSEMRGYDGPIFMTHPTKAICPILLEDYRKITVEKKGESNFFTSQMIKDCMKKVRVIDIHQSIQVDDELTITCYYAGHVLGAGMFHIRVGNQSLVYTGDFNMTPDRHLGAAWIDKCRPDVLITESTYATTIRDSKRCRERNFLKKVHGCVAKGGKVLIPVFALGRAQELCILLETYWERNNINVPIYFAAGLTEKANHYYKLFVSWTNQKIKKSFVERNMFDFKHILPFDRSFIDVPGPMVLFATPGMLHAGLSLQVFVKWAPDPNNMVIMPGYCVAGTIGAKVLAGKKTIEIDKNTTIPVRLAVEHLSFSAHADAKGIMQLIRQSEAQNVVLVHGEKAKMAFLQQKIQHEFEINCYFPANGVAIDIETPVTIPVQLSRAIVEKRQHEEAASCASEKKPSSEDAGSVRGVVVCEDSGELKFISEEEAETDLGMKEHELRFNVEFPLATQPTAASDPLVPADILAPLNTLVQLRDFIAPLVAGQDGELTVTHTSLLFRTISLQLKEDNVVVLSWSFEDDFLADSLFNSLSSDFVLKTAV